MFRLFTLAFLTLISSYGWAGSIQYDLFFFSGNALHDGSGDLGANYYFSEVLLRSGVVPESAKVALIITHEDPSEYVLRTSSKTGRPSPSISRDDLYERSLQFYGLSGKEGTLELGGRQINWMTADQALKQGAVAEIGVVQSLFPQTDDISGKNIEYRKVMSQLVTNLVGSEDYGNRRVETNRVHQWNDFHPFTVGGSSSGVVFTTGYGESVGPMDSAGHYLVPRANFQNRSVFDGKEIVNRPSDLLRVLIHPPGKFSDNPEPAKDIVDSLFLNAKKGQKVELQTTSSELYKKIVDAYIKAGSPKSLEFIENKSLYQWKTFKEFQHAIREADFVISGGLMTGMMAWNEGIPAEFLERKHLIRAYNDLSLHLDEALGKSLVETHVTAALRLGRVETARRIRSLTKISSYNKLIHLIGYGLSGPARSPLMPLWMSYVTEKFDHQARRETQAEIIELMDVEKDLPEIEKMKMNLSSEDLALIVSKDHQFFQIPSLCDRQLDETPLNVKKEQHTMKLLSPLIGNASQNVRSAIVPVLFRNAQGF